MVPERRSRPRQCAAGPLCGRYGTAGADGTTGTDDVGATAGPVCGSSFGGEPREKPADDVGRRLCVPGLRVPESSGTEAFNVATREGVPQYPSADSRGGTVVSVEWASRRGDSKAEPDFKWVVYLFPGRQQQSNIP